MNGWTPAKGELVVVWRDNGTALVTTVRDTSESNGLSVVWCEGISGFYSLQMVRPAIFHASTRKQLEGTLAGM
jgi:hypothetical protein